MNTSQLLKEEYLTLRKEIELAIAELASLEQYSVIAIAAIYTWFATKAAELDHALSFVAMLSPVLITLAGGLRCFGIHRHLYTVGTYIKQIESEVYHPPCSVRGWEHFLAELPPLKRAKTRSHIVFWCVLFVITLSVFALTEIMKIGML